MNSISAPISQSPSFLSGWRAGTTQIVLLLVSTLCQIDRILPFIMAESIKQDLGLSDTQLGLMNGVAFSVCYSLMSLPLARRADQGSPKIVMLVCIIAWSIMTAFGGFASSFLFLAITRFGVAFGEAGSIPAGHAIIARKIRPENRGTAMGLFSMGLPLGAMIGFSVGGWLNDIYGWRIALLGAGSLGMAIALLVMLGLGSTSPLKEIKANNEPFIQSSFKLLLSPAFRWLFIAAIIVGFTSAPFYMFVGPFLIRIHHYSASEAGLAFGLLQGLTGIVGTCLGGRGFDRAIRNGHQGLLLQPAILFLIASITTLIALFSPTGWMSLVLFVPGMLSFSFLLPWAFGSAHLVAGSGKQAIASSLVLIGSGLFGPALGPLIVGIISDLVSVTKIPNGLIWGMLIIPLASLLTGIATLKANRQLNKMTYSFDSF